MKRLWWCLAVFIIAVALGNFVAPPVIASMKPLENGTYTLDWSDGSATELTVSGTKKDAVVDFGDFTGEISRYSGETERGLVFLFPWEPDRRSFDFYDGTTRARIDFVDMVTVDGLRALEFRGDFDGVERTFIVERRTGTLIDASFTTDGATVSLADSTQQAHLAYAARTVRLLWWLQFLAWFSRLVAFGAATTGVVLLVRRNKTIKTAGVKH